MTERINKAELARRLNISPPRISKLVKEKKIIFDDDGLIDSEKGINQYKNNSVRLTQKELTKVNTLVNTLDEENFDYKHYKTISEKWKSKQEEVNYQVKIKELVPIYEVKKDAFKIAKELKEQLLSMPDTLCNIFAAEPDALKIRNKWIEEINKTLNEVILKLEKE